ncbi:hypothetical protein ABZ749_35450, partial [Micromonospora sp. NPDC047753]
IWYPALGENGPVTPGLLGAHGRFPVVMFSHGCSARRVGSPWPPRERDCFSVGYVPAAIRAVAACICGCGLPNAWPN